jgi:UDP-N-acetylglucosamine:LPS N-acetylglucosamine transferase
VADLCSDPARLRAMGTAARRLAAPDAARRIVSRLLEIAA